MASGVLRDETGRWWGSAVPRLPGTPGYFTLPSLDPGASADTSVAFTAPTGHTYFLYDEPMAPVGIRVDEVVALGRH